MVGESNQNVFFIKIDASSFAEFEISEFEISRFVCLIKDYLLVIWQVTPPVCFTIKEIAFRELA